MSSLRPPPANARPTPGAAGDTPMARVLVVDDSEDVRVVVRVFLEREGFEVTEAGDGTEAVRAFRARGADLVLCDVFMPGKDGLQTIRELRQLDPVLKVIAITAGGKRSGVDLLAAARALGAVTLPKPFGSSDLVGAVRRALAAPTPA